MGLPANTYWKALPGRYQEVDEQGKPKVYLTANGNKRPVWAEDSEITTKPLKTKVLREYVDLWRTHKAFAAKGEPSHLCMKALVKSLGNHYSVASIKNIVKAGMEKVGVEVTEWLPTNPGGKRGITKEDVLGIISEEAARDLFS